MRTPAPWSWKRSVAHGVALGLLLALPRVAAAQSEPRPAAAASDDKAKAKQSEADRKARELFERGRAAFREGQYRDAWENFREAYILSKRPELLYNVGQSADRMRMDRDALAAFKLYLEKLPNAENRREVESRVAYLEDRLAREGDTEINPTTLDDSTDGEGSFGLEPGDGEGRPAAPETLSDAEGEQDEQDGQDGEDESSSRPADGQPERSGWYVRLAVGLGVLADGLSESQADSLSSSTLSLLLGVGYAINEGVVIGGGVTFDGGLSPSVSIGDVTRDIKSANLGMIIAFVDYYLAPREHGWHLLGGLGVGQLSLSDTTASVGIEAATGGSLMLGGGCEWPIDRDWAIGGLLRVMLSHLSTDTAQHNAVSPSLAFTGAWY